MLRKFSLITIILLLSLVTISNPVIPIQLEQQLEKQLNPGYQGECPGGPQLIIINDTLIATWVADDGLKISTSTDNGNNWSDVRRIREDISASYHFSYPKTIGYENQVFISWIENNRYCYLIKSSDNGLTWTDKITLFEKNESITNDFIREYNIITTSKGLYFFYLVVLENYTQTLTYKFSSNYGNDWINSEKYLFYCSSDDWPGLIVNSFEDYIHIFLVQQYETSKELIYIRSEDSGVTWSQETVLSYDPDRIPLYPDDGIDSMYPSCSVIENKIFCKWEDVGVGEFYRYSEDNGQTWIDPKSFSIDAPGFFVEFKDEMYYFFDVNYLDQDNWSVGIGYEVSTSSLRDIKVTSDHIHTILEPPDRIIYKRYGEFHDQTSNHIDNGGDAGDNGMGEDYLLISIIIMLFLFLALVAIFFVVRRKQKR